MPESRSEITHIETPGERLTRYEREAEPLTVSEIASIWEGRCGPLRYGGPCWLMPGHVGPHHCYREDIEAVVNHVRKPPAFPPCGHCGATTSCGKQDCDRTRALSASTVEGGGDRG